MEDSAIVELYFQRNEEAITESDRKYGRYCAAIAANILHNREDEEECVSDTWLRAWNAIPPARPRILRAFFGKIVRNLSLNRWEMQRAGKRGGGETGVALDELAECLADPGLMEWSADRSVIADVLNRFLAGLSGEERIMFVRRYWYLDSVKEIAASMGFGESKVKMTLLRTRRALAAQLAEEGIIV